MMNKTMNKDSTGNKKRPTLPESIRHINKPDKGRFNLDEFKTIKSRGDMIDYVEGKLQLVGSGSSRIVWALSSRYALKVAFNLAGVAQNRTEERFSGNPNHKQVIAAVIASDTVRGNWVISELVRPVTPKEFRQAIGVAMADISLLVRRNETAKAHPSLTNNLTQAGRTLVDGIQALVDDGMARDFREGQFGKTADGRIVLLDSGLDMETFNKFYESVSDGGNDIINSGNITESSTTPMTTTISEVLFGLLQSESIRSTDKRNRFNFEEFKNLSHDQMIRYASSRLKQVGKGSSRSAFVLSSRYVLKVARYPAGQEQNKAERDLYDRAKSTPAGNVIPKVYAGSREGEWIVSDLVKPFDKERDLKHVAGADANEIADLIYDYGIIHNAAELDYAVLSTNAEIDYGFTLTPVGYALIVGIVKLVGMGATPDIHIEQFGQTPDGRVVMVDTGFTDEIGDRFYGVNRNKWASPAGNNRR